MLITVIGRKSGREYTTPENYVQQGSTMTVLTRRSRKWWRNIEGGTRVSMLVRGERLHGFAQIVPANPDTLPTALLAFYKRMSPVGISAERVAKLAQESLVISIELSGGGGGQGKRDRALTFEWPSRELAPEYVRIND
jgi:hypothetical protein